MREADRMGVAYGVGSVARDAEIDLLWVHEYLKEIPCVRWDKVADLRRQLASGSWQPETDKIAGRVLQMHLQHPDPF